MQYRDDLVDLLGEAVAEYMDAFPKATLYAQEALSWEFDRLQELDLLSEEDEVNARLADCDGCGDSGLEVDEETGEVNKEYVITDFMLGE